MSALNRAQLPPGLVVNADDLGVHPHINEGIISAYEKGIVSSTSLLVTTPYLHTTIKRLVGASGPPVGLHLCLTQGRAIAPISKVPALVDEEGNFRIAAWRFLMLGRQATSSANIFRQIRDEFTAQLSIAKDFGINLTHVDSHQHIHMNPAIYEIVQDAAPRFGVRSIRFVREPCSSLLVLVGLGHAVRRTNHAKWALLRWNARQIVPRLKTTDRFFGLLHSGIISKPVLLSVLRRVPANVSLEICIHPGFPPVHASAAAGAPYDPDHFTTSSFRQVEHDALVDPEVIEMIKRGGLRLRSFTGAEKQAT